MKTITYLKGGGRSGQEIQWRSDVRSSDKEELQPGLGRMERSLKVKLRHCEGFCST